MEVTTQAGSAAALAGVIVVNKPGGWTSHDVVAKMRGIAGTRRVGHLGTLDPIATGVLPVMIGNVTRLARFWEDSEKAYEAVVRFGFATSTYDRAGERTTEPVEPVLSVEGLESALAPMRGELEQVPPPVSAKKIGGVPAYELARKNVAVHLKPVRVSVFELTLLELTGPRASLRIRCSPGTYIRSIAHELGMTLGCGAHVEELVRTASGPFRIEQAYTLEQLQQSKGEDRLESALLRPEELLAHIPPVHVDEATLLQIRQGRDFPVSAFRASPGTKYVKVIGVDGKLAAIGQAVLPNLYHPTVVL